MIRKNLFITEVKTIKSDRHTLDWSRRTGDPVFYNNLDEIANLEVIHECIIARRYINRNGRVLHIGLSQEVEEALGVVYEVYEKMEGERDRARQQRDWLSGQLYAAHAENYRLHEMINIFRKSWSYRIKKVIADYLEML